MSAWTLTPVKDEGPKGAFPKAPPGNHLAALVAVVDMGTQFAEGYNGEPGKWQKKAYFVWELLTEQAEGTTRNHLIARDLTFSLHEKATLRKWIESRRGKKIADDAPLDITEELGKPCLLNVIEKGKYTKVDGLSAVPKGMPAPEPQNKPVAVSLDQFRANPGVIPDWVPWLYGKAIGDHIQGCKELGGKAPAPTSGATGATSGHDAGAGTLNTPARLDVFLDDDWTPHTREQIAKGLGEGLYAPDLMARVPGTKDKRTLKDWGFCGDGSEIPF